MLVSVFGNKKLVHKYTLFYTGEVAGTNQRHMISKNGRIITTRKYRNFKRALINSWIIQPQHKIKSKIYIEILFIIDKRRDADSLLKPIFDSLEAANIIKNDNQIIGYFVEKQNRLKNQPNMIKLDIYEVIE